jgi:transposase
VVLRDRQIGHLYTRVHPHQKASLTHILDDIIYVMRTGIAWRQLRSSIKWFTVYYHFKRFSKHHIFEKLFLVIRNRYLKTYPLTHFAVDTTFIPNRYGRHLGKRNQFYKNKRGNKISVMSDLRGVPLSIFVGKGVKHDLQFVRSHLKDLRRTITTVHHPYLLADKIYESRQLRQDALNEYGITMMVKKKKNMKANYFYDPDVYRKRICVEHTMARLKQNRRVGHRYDHQIHQFRSFVHMAASLVILHFM